MIRPALFAATAALGLALPLATSTAQAHYPPDCYPGKTPHCYPPTPHCYPPTPPCYPPTPHCYPPSPPSYPTTPVCYPPAPPCRPVCDHWRVCFRRCCSEPWRTYGEYRSEYRARGIAQELRGDGYNTYVAVDG